MCAPPKVAGVSWIFSARRSADNITPPQPAALRRADAQRALRTGVVQASVAGLQLRVVALILRPGFIKRAFS